MHSFSLREREIRDDISVCSARSITSSAFPRSFSLTRSIRNSKTIHFRDDLSEYSNPSNWGERSGPLSLSDHRVHAEGLQARRTVGEAILRAQWERQRDAEAEVCTENCTCLGPRAARLCLGALRRAPPRPATLFTWGEVQSLLMLPSEEKGPFLIVVTTFRPREDGSREWMLQAGSLRARARWGAEMCVATIRDRLSATMPVVNTRCGCCGRATSLSLALFMDMVRVACEVARLQPSAEDMERLMELLDMLVDSQVGSSESRRQRRGGSPERGGSPDPPAMPASQHRPAPHIPVAALRRFKDAVRRAHSDFLLWRQWWEVSRLVRPPCGWDADLWLSRVLPFLQPEDPTGEMPSAQELRHTPMGYPPCVDNQVTSAAERCHRTLSS